MALCAGTELHIARIKAWIQPIFSFRLTFRAGMRAQDGSGPDRQVAPAGHPVRSPSKADQPGVAIEYIPDLVFTIAPNPSFYGPVRW